MLCITKDLIKHQSSVYIKLNDQTVLFQAIQFSVSKQFSSIWPIDRILSGATPPGSSGPRSNSNIGVLRIPQSSSITEASPSHCLVSYPGHSLGKSYSFAKMELVYSAVPANWAIYEVQNYFLMFLIHIKVSWLTIVESDPKVPFTIPTTTRCKRRCYFFPWIAPLTLDPYLILMSVCRINKRTVEGNNTQQQ